MAQDKPKFIRKNGKIIPIGGKSKKKGPGKFDKARKVARKAIRAEDKQIKTEQKLESRQRGFRAVGVLGGLLAGGIVGSKLKLPAFGALSGGAAGLIGGEVAGSKTKKSKALSKKSKMLGNVVLKKHRKGRKLVGDAFGDVYGEEFGKMANVQRF